MADNQEKSYASSFKTVQIALYKVGQEHLKPFVNLYQGNQGLCTSIQYHEDIFWPCYGATMILSDSAVNLIAEMPIQGWEKVVLEVEDATEQRYSYELSLIHI